MSPPSLLKPENKGMSGWPSLRRQPGDPRVVISLSTVPAGIRGLEPTLRSLRRQTFPADAIELNVPNVSRRGLGTYPGLPAMDAAGVDVYHTEDWLALTNIVPTMQRAQAANQSTLVIVVDDDKVYPPSLVEDHMRAHRERPRSASACRGYRMPPGGDLSRIDFWPMWDELAHSVYGHKLAEAERVAVVTGSDSWAAPVGLFSPSLWRDLPPLDDSEGAALLMNDVWISGQLSRRGVSKYVVPCRREASDAPKSKERDGQNLARNMTRRRDLNQEVMQLYLKDWASDEIMPMSEVKRRVWPHETWERAPPPERPAVISWVAGRLASGIRALLAA